MAHIPINVIEYRSLNFTEGVKSCPVLRFATDEKIMEGILSKGVTKIRRITRWNKEMQVAKPTNSIILHLHSTQLPETVLASIYRLGVRLYVSPPISCKKCQVYGHTKKYCNIEVIFPICCGIPDHTADH